MKVLIIEDDHGAIINMVKTLKDLNHEVGLIYTAGLEISNPNISPLVQIGDDDSTEKDWEKVIAQAAITFQPDVILLDHNLDLESFTGATVNNILQKLNLKTKIIGTSLGFRQSYVKYVFDMKDMLEEPSMVEIFKLHIEL